MKVIKIEAFGGPEMLSLTTVPAPVAKENEVLINVESCGVGGVDILLRKGLYPGLDNAGFIPGMEIVGIVNSVGANVSEEWISKRVYAMTTLGGYAEQVVVNESALVEVPEKLLSDQALSLGINALVAYYSLQRARLSEGERVYVRGAGGGIGSLTVQLALANKYEVSVAPTAALQRGKLQHLGVRNFIDLSQWEGDDQKFDAIIDPVAGSELAQYIALLKDNGVYVLNGVAAGFPNADFGMEFLKRFQSSLTITCFSLNSISADDIRSSLSQIFHLAVDGQITPYVSKVLPFEEAVEAHRLLESQTVFGKIVLKI
ncbi:zinc-binding dehydrogenase [Danxiaibacter flavus]|uniref:Zinc-binding dehydrogenase n=1 Tax=Danxiaibacter flavus TaxID=3049108 RepID=A0ABV3ZI51_9BACT|nr:zinc-binding dehydrogenase [Chitinophagaceae bacterium DXS]